MFPLFLATLLLAACGEFDDGDRTPDPEGVVTIRGMLLGPDGVTAMADATVYNKPGSVAASSLIPQAEEGICATPWKEFEAYACTDSDGAFILETTYSGGSTTLVARKGAWTVELDIEITAEEMDVGLIIFSANPREDGARIAVVYGTHDDTGLVLDKLGMGDAYDMFSDSTHAPDTFVLLFEDLDADGKADIYNYDLVFFDCGMDAMAAVAGDRASTLRAYVEAGGSIYATDWSYLIVEQAFPEFIDFRGDDTDPYNVMSGREMDRLDAEVVDGALASRLDDSTCGAGGCLNEDGTVRLLNFENLWAVMDGVEATAAGASVKVLVEGDISLPGAEPDIVPLAVTFEVGAGQVMFTSFHAHSGDAGSAFMPQERVLEFLVSGY